ncbi:metal-dependent hydrolase [Salinirubellus sp. GCM10025818]|uniref:metal-dependent hydrolase n=1 Tax=Salinirubellus TaxID=2162630 RepID=UPI0030CD30CF
MMVITHVAVALLFAVPVALVEPSLAGPAAVGAFVGGALPDLDLFVGVHRRTLHFPVVGPALAVPAVGLALLVTTPLTVGAALALVGLGVHSASDALGAGEELRPWERTNTDAVYDHVGGRWWQARYVVPYDGSPRDLLVAVAASLPVLVVYDGPVRLVLGGLLGMAAVYTLLRRRLVPYFERVV